MSDGEGDARRKLREFQFPIGNQRSRHDEQARGRGLVAFQIEQQRNHLYGFAETHIVREAGAEPEANDEPQPGIAGLLIGAQFRLQAEWRLQAGFRRSQSLENRI